ncbi:hypothetical protein HELRODRAFT_188955 [Helobdella robusta]|uniref:Uncharacterized protein n=1 Tax=Helobdella robusta TaxID=6412 RepID=T1FQI1_HELRO|nr:hypothetical protein HELRODRAFT_188955 [Helobdella robusta]ESN98917.1 hypothetical protein HELRODRAFT_188955 [Helobdella robusta]
MTAYPSYAYAHTHTYKRRFSQEQITFLDVPLFQHPIINTDAQIKCHVVGSPTPIISWKYNGRQSITNEANSRDSRKIVQHGYLLIKNITTADNGLYTCAAELPSAGAYDERIINVTVYIPPKVTKPIGHVTEIEGNSLEVTCNATGLPKPKYKFFKGKKQLQATNRMEINDEQGKLKIRSLVKSDEGSYVCRAYSEAGENSVEGSIAVKVPPKIMELKNLTLDQGMTASISCKAKGDLPLSISFFKESTKEIFREGYNQDRYSVLKKSPYEIVLQINYLRPDDMSGYICKASNDYGKDDATGYLEVAYKPTFPTKRNRLKEYSWVGRVHNITCSVNANPPVSGFVWDRRGIYLTDNVTYRMFEHKGNYSLQIRVKPSDENWIYGEYTCIAQNTKGSTKHTITLDKGTENKKSSEKLKLENLKMNSKYTVKVRAKNEVGSGPEQVLTFTTASKSKPSPIIINSNREGPNAYQYKLMWETPKTGGTPIREYEIKFRKSINQNQLWALKDECSVSGNSLGATWQEFKYSDNPLRPSKSYTLYDLEPETNYDVIIHAFNELGKSESNSMFCFRTSKVSDVDEELASRSRDVRIWVVLLITIVIFILVIVVVDVTCYYVNSCGMTMFVCVKFCKKERPLSRKEQEMEQHQCPQNRKQSDHYQQCDQQLQTLCTTLLVAIYFKFTLCSNCDMQTSSSFIKEKCELRDGSVQTRDDGNSQYISRDGILMSKPDRRSVLSQGDEKWKDVVDELEKELKNKLFERNQNEGSRSKDLAKRLSALEKQPQHNVNQAISESGFVSEKATPESVLNVDTSNLITVTAKKESDEMKTKGGIENLIAIKDEEEKSVEIKLVDISDDDETGDGGYIGVGYGIGEFDLTEFNINEYDLNVDRANYAENNINANKLDNVYENENKSPLVTPVGRESLLDMGQAPIPPPPDPPILNKPASKQASYLIPTYH